MQLLIIFFIVLVIPFLVMPKYIYDKRRGPYEAVIMSDIVVCAAVTIFLMIQSATGDGLFTQLHDAIAGTVKMMAGDANVIKAFGMEELTSAERVTALSELYDEVLKLLPMNIFIAGAIVSYIAYILLSRSLAKRGPVELMPKLRDFNFPRRAVIAMLTAYLLVWMLTATEGFSDNSFFVNIDMMFDFFFFLQGMSVIFLLFYLKRIPKGFALILCIVLWYIYIGRTIVVVIGMFDLIAGLKIRMNMNSGRES